MYYLVDMIPSTLNNYTVLQYTVNLTVGSNKVVEEVILDTTTNQVSLATSDCEKCRSRDYNVSLSTNATRVDPAQGEELLKVSETLYNICFSTGLVPRRAILTKILSALTRTSVLTISNSSASQSRKDSTISMEC